MLTIIHDPVATAKAVSLRYVNDTTPGIERIKKGKGFTYKLENKIVKDEQVLQRIKSLVLPPAWESVWICPHEQGHLQATGKDALARKQYRYHPQWNEIRSQTKFFRLYHFGSLLSKMRLQIEKHLAKESLSKEKVLAAAVSLMERTHIRIGNSMYEKLYGSHGLTTLKDRHVEVKGGNVKFEFVGKKGVKHTINLKNRKLGNIVQKCKDIPGKDLFQFHDEQGQRHCIDSGMVNEYIKEISGGENFTAKDFRTWAGSMEALRALNELGDYETPQEAKQKSISALDKVSGLLGNTRTVCKKYYVHPYIFSLYEDKGLKNYLKHMDKIEKNNNRADLNAEEKILMKILSSNH